MLKDIYVYKDLKILKSYVSQIFLCIFLSNIICLILNVYLTYIYISVLFVHIFDVCTYELFIYFYHKAGYYIFMLIDSYMGTFNLVGTALLECIVVAWIYGKP
jgi:hypothetical protein